MGLESADKLWKKDETAALIALYESEKSLYDKNDKLYSDIQKRKEGFERIRQVMQRIRPGCTVADIKSRIKYLRNQYASELLRRNISIDSNICTKDSYKPVLWCFGLLQFLDDFITVKKFSSKIDTSEEEKSDGPEISNKNQNSKTLFAKKSHKESSETTLKKKEKLNGEINEENKKLKKRKVDSSSTEGAEKHTSQISKPEKSALSQMPATPTMEQMPATPTVEQTPAISTVEQMPATPTVEQVSPIKDCDREDIFGHYVASEMRALRDNPVLYLQTKQSILEILTSANFELINPE